MALLAIGPDFEITFPTWDVALYLIVRWIHLVAGITWIGLLYFFNLVNTPFLRGLDMGTKGKIFPALMKRAMFWFRWSAVVTVLAGLSYWCVFIILVEARNARVQGIPANGRFTLMWFLVIWTAAFAVEMAILMSPVRALKSGPVLGTIVGILVVGAGYLWLSLNSHAWESSRLQSIGIGGGIGWFMLLNVWGVIWRAQKKLIVWMSEMGKSGKPLPQEAIQLAQQVLVVSRINFALSFPMLLFMAAASHYPFIIE